MQKIIIVILCACLFISCTSTRVQNNGSGAGTTREHLDSLRGAQSESAAASATLDGQLKAAGEQSADLRTEITESAGSVKKLERAVTGGADDIAEFKHIIERIRKRGSTDTGGTER